MAKAKVNAITIDHGKNIITVDNPSIGEIVIVVAEMLFRAIFGANKSADSSNNEEIGKRGRSGSS